MPKGYGAAYWVLTQVRDAIVAEVQTTGTSFPRVSIVPGAIAWDDCAEHCGLLALAVSRMYLSSTFPGETVDQDNQSGSVLAVDVVIQAIRCAPSADAIGSMSPSVTALDRSAQVVLNDAWAVMCATSTRLDALFDQTVITDWVLRQQTFAGPEGGCVGSETIFTVGVPR